MKSKSLPILVGAAIVAAAGLAIPQAHAGFINEVPADVTNFAVLYEGNGNTLMNNGSSNITGNIGIGAQNGTSGSWAASGPGTITGVIEFATGTSSNFTTSNTTYVPALATGVNPTFNNANVTSDLNALNTLSTTLGGASGTALTINLNNNQSQTINASSGMLDANGNRVFTLSSLNFTNGATLDIQGDAAGDSVVINIPGSVGNVNFGGAIVLTGGLTADQVLFNVTGTNSLSINTNGVTETADFLDPDGMINENHSVVDGRLFGGDTQNMSIVSGGVLNAPPPRPVPAPLIGHGLLVLLAVSGVLSGGKLLESLKKRHLHAA
jgi:hypothetical protein